MLVKIWGWQPLYKIFSSLPMEILGPPQIMVKDILIEFDNEICSNN